MVTATFKWAMVLVARLLIAIALIWFFVGPARLIEGCRLLVGSKPVPILAVFGVTIIAFLAKTVKWQVFLLAEDVHVGYGRLLRYYMVSCFFNVFLPSSAGGDVKRMFDVALDTDKKAAAIASILADRGTGVYCTIVYCFFVALLRWSRIGGLWVSGPIALVTGGVTIGVPAMLWAFDRIGPRMARWGHLFEKLFRILQSVTLQVRHPVGLTVGLGLSFVVLLLAIAQVWCLAQALSVPLPWESFFVSVPLVFGLASLPITINGIGVREGGFIYFFGLYGVAPESAVAISLGVLALLTVLGLVGGVIFVAARSERLEPISLPLGRRDR